MKQDKKNPKRNCFKRIIEKINDRKIIILSVVFVVCFVLGVWGFYREAGSNEKLEDIDFLNAIYLTLTLFALNYSELIEDGVLNVARFGASVFTIGGFLIIFGQGIAFIRNYLKGKFGANSVFVYGDTEEARAVAESIGTDAVTSSKSLLTAKSYVLMGNEEDNLKFYYENEDKFGTKPVYVKTDVFGGIMTKNGKHTFFSTDEIVAKKYWTRNLLLEQAIENNYHLDIAIVGFNSLGEELLFQALQMNIFDAKQQITYHLWGESSFSDKEKDVEKEYLACFEATHKNLDTLHVVVHHEPWYKEIALLDTMDRIIIADYKNAIPMAQRMLQRIYVYNTRLDIFYHGTIDENLFIDHRYGRIEDQVNKKCNGTEHWIQLFNYLEEGCDWKEISSDEMIEVSKQLNWEWEKKYQTGKENPEAAWREKEAEKRFSNYASAYSQVTRSKLVELWNKQESPANHQKTWKDYIVRLAELEHIRWCNYYWFLNWQFAEMGTFIPDKPNARKNTLLRIHNDLKAYADLDNDVQENDQFQVQIGFEAEERGLYTSRR